MEIKKNLGFYFGLGLLVFASFMFWQSFSYQYYTDFGPGPGLLPRWLNGGLIILSLIYIFTSVVKSPISFSEVIPKGETLKKVLLFPGAVIIFVLIVNHTGFNIAGTSMLFLLLRKEYKWYLALGISAVVCGFLFLVFKTLLLVPLPVNALGW